MQANYYTFWKQFNQFFIKLDHKPLNWSDRLNLFVAYLVNNNQKSTTVKSYISAIKAVLWDVGITINEDGVLLAMLTRACKLCNDQLRAKLPV